MTARTPVTKLPEPELGLTLIPKDRYLTRAFAAREADALWPRVWNLVGPTSDVEEPGDYLAFELGDESVLVVRGDDGVLRAFHNVCQHRGRRLREAGCGHAGDFQCPYHRSRGCPTPRTSARATPRAAWRSPRCAARHGTAGCS